MKGSKFPTGSEFYDAHLAKIEHSGDHQVKLSNWITKPRDFLVYLGSPGTGKTFFCAAFSNYLREKKKHCLYLRERDFFSELRECVGKGWDTSYAIENLLDIPFIIFDDLGSGRNLSKDLTDWQYEQLFAFIDGRTECRLPTIITSNLFLNDIKEKFDPRFYSRISAKRNTIIQLKDEDLRQKDWEK